MAERKRTPSTSNSKLRRVPNPVHLSEDEADYIISERRLRDEPGGVTIEEYLHKHGCSLERGPETKR